MYNLGCTIGWVRVSKVFIALLPPNTHIHAPPTPLCAGA